MSNETKTVYVRIVACDCDDCQTELFEECRRTRIGMPQGERTLIPERWIGRECPHGRNGLTFEIIPQSTEPLVVEDENIHLAGDSPQPSLDATKGIGYAARETGRYGSHPSHDGFHGDSDS